MASIKYKENGEYKDIVVKVGDTLPIGTEVDYNGTEVPNGWEQVSDPNEYSTTEQVVGKWIDGKPIYRKVIELNNITSSTSNTDFVSLASLNIDKPVHLYGYYYAGGNKFSVPFTDSNSNYSVMFVSAENNLRGRIVNSATSIYAKVVLEYTKTTD